MAALGMPSAQRIYLQPTLFREENLPSTASCSAVPQSSFYSQHRISNTCMSGVSVKDSQLSTVSSASSLFFAASEIHGIHRASRTLSSSSSQQMRQSPVCVQASETATQEERKPRGGEELNGTGPIPIVSDENGASNKVDDFGDVQTILSSKVVDRKTQYLIQWKDDHPDSWEPSENIARDVTSPYEDEWWTAAKKASDQKMQELLEGGRDVNSIDENQRTALHFAAGLGSEKVVRFLVNSGANIHWQDKDGFTALHIASGYVHTTVVKVLLEFGADPEAEDAQGRSVLQLAQQLLEKTPKANPMQFARRMALDQVVKLLDEATFEEVEVEQVLDKRMVEGKIEFLVKWSDDSEDSWEPIENIGEDLVRDFEEGLEYGIAEKVLEKRETKETGVEYLVKWADSEDTWEPEENVAAEIIAEFEGVGVEVVEKRLQKKLEGKVKK